MSPVELTDLLTACSNIFGTGSSSSIKIRANCLENIGTFAAPWINIRGTGLLCAKNLAAVFLDCCAFFDAPCTNISGTGCL